MCSRFTPDCPRVASMNERMAEGAKALYDKAKPDYDLLTLLYCHKDYERFKAFWKERNAHPNESPADFFKAHLGEIGKQ
jgi:hypothetical protein